ncbi:MAG: CBS domain-containing protein [Bacteroidetes bacterium]|nr:MAG: CBS domain-containing protein [Bacteroidota bacterium]
MGDLNVKSVHSKEEMQQFMRYLLKDIQALERMLKEEWFETDTIRIGAEQEMCLVAPNWKPTHLNMQALEVINDERFTSELANFNLEANLQPQELRNKAFSLLHQELKETLDKAQDKINALGAKIVLVGILPTIRKTDVEIENITPLDRYKALMNALKDLRGEAFELRISGIDEVNLQQKTAMLEACNTSFQVHLQVKPDEFARKYNYAQALAGPTMAVAVNSPLLFGRRLWQETRIALFQQSIDIRTFTEHLRERSPRVTFGNHWLEHSVMEIYKEDVARFKVLLSTEIDEDVFEKLQAGITPKLRALNIHNSTVYRWNRPCYGISPNGKPHLRIENRILPAGPSVPDAIANAAFWVGLMNGIEDEYPDITKVMEFSDAKAGFFAAARFGLDSKLPWVHGKKIASGELILEQLLPIARHGLQKVNIDQDDIDKYLEIIEARTKSAQTGSCWMLDSYSKLGKEGLLPDEISTAITASIYAHQYVGRPIHEWELASIDKIATYEPSSLLVEEFMLTDIITVQEDDIIDLVANLMNWRRIRHIPVEDKAGKLVGLITSRMVMRYYSERDLHGDKGELPTVKTLMNPNPITISPKAPITKAMEIMQKNKIGCLPVVLDDEEDGKEKKGLGKLVGMITEAEFLSITSSLITRLAKQNEHQKNAVVK